MTFNQFIFKVIFFNFRKYLTYFFCITFSMTVFFLFTTIWYVPNFTEQSSAGIRQIVQIGAIISSAFSVFLITYSYNHFFKGRTKEFGVLISYGLLYRDMKKMIILENSLIFLGALIAAFISGSVFSRLFFMMTTTILGIDEISFVLTYKSFLLTTISFIPIYFLIVILTILKIRKYSVTKLIKVNRVKEMKHDGSKLLALLGLVVIVISLLFLYVYK